MATSKMALSIVNHATTSAVHAVKARQIAVLVVRLIELILRNACAQMPTLKKTPLKLANNVIINVHFASAQQTNACRVQAQTEVLPLNAHVRTASTMMVLMLIASLAKFHARHV